MKIQMHETRRAPYVYRVGGHEYTFLMNPAGELVCEVEDPKDAQFMLQVLRPDGVTVFTIHGEAPVKAAEDVKKDSVPDDGLDDMTFDELCAEYRQRTGQDVDEEKESIDSLVEKIRAYNRG